MQYRHFRLNCVIHDLNPSSMAVTFKKENLTQIMSDKQVSGRFTGKHFHHIYTVHSVLRAQYEEKKNIIKTSGSGDAFSL